MTIRPAAPTDHDAIARVCLLTGAQGGDATGRFGDDSSLSDVYATPYLHGPGAFCLVWDVDGEARGYVLGAADTGAFQDWFVAEWWPHVGPRHVARTAADAWLLPSAADPGRMLIPQLADYPAHLHIDLLPDQQGRGAGRALIDAACALLAERGVPGVHLVAERANRGAQAFYPRVGFRAVGWDDATVTFARTLPGDPPVAK
ncbi:GNAT family N-acetyltransferase [Demequina sp. SYSU T00039]|uniref:GNAT family N-acetyltransferase n=1 Tax=Demequina lignilytica TaxID=3051663 RepID=A0AAW7MA01_9MICO|nr:MULTISPECIES: GNAT family N-acetyltransferase [unclassified Demequina]MDN4479137.1 GNAT family N-acetyltransferase [Demequina sp. SYSU T00039-1]MDN4489150.1 GNAT family N-acetyltransferase [Demequina sp. SYSU T00039]MDN4490253.1 GNAT family N-acetyltransferase [Demequina sp. SYSU T00068]